MKNLSATNKAKQIQQIHQRMLIIAWIVLANIGLWAHFFKYRSWAIPLHKGSMLILTLMTWLAIFIAIVLFGIDNGGRIHNLHIALGLTIMVMSGLATAGGIVCSISESTPNLSPTFVKIVRKAHKIIGWAVIAIVLIQFVSTTKKKHFLPVLIINAISISAYLITKIFNKKMQKVSPSILEESARSGYDLNLRTIRNQKDLQIFNQDYFIFADKVYDISQVLTSHPAGWQIIKTIKGRQVDRYLYGTQPLQNSTGQNSPVLIHKHTKASTSLMGPPIAQLYSPQFYNTFQQTNVVCIEDLIKHCKNQSMYVVYLVSKLKPFEYMGYIELCQFGKYYTLNMNKFTKLYSCVNFLHASNIRLMQRIIGSAPWQSVKVVNYNGAIHQVIVRQELTTQDFRLLPLFIKKYQSGAFTKQFLSGNCTSQLVISKVMGRGLSLHEMPPGMIIMFAGGTGFNVFCDLIDLVFKETLINQGNPLTNQIMKGDPILRNRPFGIFEFILYLSVQDVGQIHPLTLFQLNYLASRGRMKVWIKSKQTAQKAILMRNYSFIQQISTRFESVIKQWISYQNKISQIYICGTPQFNGSILRQLNYNYFPASKRRSL